MARCGNASEYTVTIGNFFDEPTFYAKILKPRMVRKTIGKATIIEYPLAQPEHEDNRPMAQVNKSVLLKKFITPLQSTRLKNKINFIQFVGF